MCMAGGREKMIIVMDSDQNPNDPRVHTLLENLKVDKRNVFNISDCSQSNNLQTNQILLITSLDIDWMGYHKKFVEAYKDQVQSWLAVVTGSNQIAVAHMQWYFDSESIDFHCYNLFEEEPAALAAKLQVVKPLRQNSLLLYSVNPSCGKKTMKEILEKYLLPNWTIEIAEEDANNPVEDVLSKSDAAVKVIVSNKFETFYYKKWEASIHPFFVLTMPDQNVALYLQTEHGKKNNGHKWAYKDLETLAKQTGMTASAVERRLFFLSPLYELWRLSETNPSNDVRFVMWDDFGLPLPRNQYNDALIHDFLSQFTQGEEFVSAIR